MHLLVSRGRNGAPEQLHGEHCKTQNLQKLANSQGSCLQMKTDRHATNGQLLTEIPGGEKKRSMFFSCLTFIYRIKISHHVMKTDEYQASILHQQTPIFDAQNDHRALALRNKKVP